MHKFFAVFSGMDGFATGRHKPRADMFLVICVCLLISDKECAERKVSPLQSVLVTTLGKNKPRVSVLILAKSPIGQYIALTLSDTDITLKEKSNIA